MNDLILVAKIGKTYGLKGFLKLHNQSDFPEQFKKNAKFYDKFKNEFIVKQFDKNNQSIQFVSYEDIDKAKELINLELYSTIDDTRKNIKLKKDEFFYFDIIGKEVSENGEILGKIVDILDQGANFLFEIKTDEALVLQEFSKTFYIPYHDNFVLSINEAVLVKNCKDILRNS